jgi:uncharacterized protein with gpF-like domain
MATHSKHLNPLDLKAIFGLEPANAIAYLKAKGYAITWQDQLDHAHDQAFTVAKAMRLDLLSDIRAALETALQQGQTLKQFTAHLQPTCKPKAGGANKSSSTQTATPNPPNSAAHAA